jgi:D-alanine-D-alanine ligase-like ATP-grasp enzyme
MTRITIATWIGLSRSGLTPESVPPQAGGLLRDTANLSTGGTAVDRTDDIHPENALIARRAARPSASMCAASTSWHRTSRNPCTRPAAGSWR